LIHHSSALILSSSQTKAITWRRLLLLALSAIAYNKALEPFKATI